MMNTAVTEIRRGHICVRRGKLGRDWSARSATEFGGGILRQWSRNLRTASTSRVFAGRQMEKAEADELGRAGD